jgi:outer membrane receptor protein involved in Fe transport
MKHVVGDRFVIPAKAGIRGQFVIPAKAGIHVVALTAIATLLTAGTLAAQSPRRTADTLATRDTARSRRLDPVVVTAERVDAPLTTSAAAVTRLSGEALRKLPVKTVADALQYVPGMLVIQGDGLGLAPRLVVRGFYGGGETDYATVLIDGVPATQLATGAVNWDLVPLQAIESIEVIRGGASPLYGDAAVGGVVNLITRRNQPVGRWSLGGGEFGQAQGSGALGGSLGTHHASVFGDVRRSTGYRAHERRDGGSIGASIGLRESATSALTLSTLNHFRSFNEPGPLADSSLARDDRAASAFFRFDNTDERTHRLSLDGASSLNEHARLSGYLTGEATRTDAVRTLPLSSAFADTKDRRIAADRLVGSLQSEFSGLFAGIGHRLVVGTDAATGRLGSEYYKIVTGGTAAYANSAGANGAQDSKGVGHRSNAATFAHWEGTITSALRLSLGGRMDWITDKYEPLAPSTGSAKDVFRSAFSPRAGINVRYMDTEMQGGSIYVTAGRSFKAPTMDQLFDQRRTPVPFPPFSISTSNAALEAQFGKSAEVGLNHHATVVPGSLDAKFSVSAYQTDMRNELDFDLKTFKYVNLGTSRHRGLETGLTLDGPSALSAFANLTLQRITSTSGTDDGKLLKAIPQRVVATGISHNSLTSLGGAVSLVNVGDSWLDDANTLTLAGHTQIDARVSYPVAHLRFSVDVRNIFDSKFSSTGFPDPAGSPLVYYFPAAGRVLSVGLQSGW